MIHDVETTTETRAATVDYLLREIAAMTDDEVLEFMAYCSEHGLVLPELRYHVV